jgi:eukaryotic-like serine/threonine-protein kinase
VPAQISKTAELIAGYTLQERIGSGGYGEVWRAVAPGGLLKAIKFIYGRFDEERASCELKALHRIKEVRHPFLLSLERIETIDGQLVIFTELADASLSDRFEACKAAGMPGVPRDELLVYLRDAADALDYMSERFQLQHLDIKPENLLVVGGHVKVADFGLVKDVQDVTVSLMGGMTPVYASPEVFDGHPSLQSDQYSLAIVYQEMLTGVLPFPGKTPAQLTSQHLHGHPRLTPLSSTDRPVIARALDKDPQRRFSNCRELIEALRGAENNQPAPTATVPPKAPAREIFRTITISNLESNCDTEAKARAKLAPPISIEAEPSAQPIEPRHKRESEALAGPAAPASQAVPARQVESADEQPASEANYEEFDTHTRNTLNSIASLGQGQALPHPAELPPAEFENLPAFESPFTTAEFRPVLVIGVGGIAARVLQHLQRRWQQRFEDFDDVPIFETLLLDTDSQTLAKLSTSPDRASRLTELEHLPLRKPDEYRDQGDQITRWLAHRWIYNIPRSLRTEGLRPLGRLALIDNAAAVTARLRKTLKRVTSPEALEAAGKKLGLPITNSAPLVYLVAAISGGTGSGMVLDLGFAVRQAAAIEGLASARVCGVLLHGASRHPAEQKLAVANSHACLSELYAYERKYPGEPAWGVPATKDGRAPFDDTYFLHLGDDLGESELNAESEKIADYLDLDASTACRAFFEKCRTGEGSAVSPERNLRSMGLSRLGIAAEDIPAADIESFCRHLADYWHQSPMDIAPRTLPPPAGAAAESARPSLALATILDCETLAGKVVELVHEQVGMSDENALQQTLDKSCQFSGTTGEATAARAQQTLDALFATVRSLVENGTVSNVGGNEPVFPPLVNLAAAEGAAVQSRILDQLDHSDGGLAGLQKTLDELRQELHRRERDACQRQERLREVIAQAEMLLAPQSTSGKKTWIRRLFLQEKKSPSSPCWNEYARWRLELVVLHAQRYLWHALYAALSVVNEQCREMRQDMQAVSQELQHSRPQAESSQANVNWAFETLLKNAWCELLGKHRRVLAGKLERRLRRTMLAEFLAEEGSRKICSPKARADSLRQAVRLELANLLREIDLAGVVLSSPGTADAPSPLQLLLDRAKPPQYSNYGGAQRFLVGCPKDAATEKIKANVEVAAQIGTSLAPTAGCEFFFCYEVERVPIRRIAAHLLENHDDCREIAAKLRARIDVAWPGDF